MMGFRYPSEPFSTGQAKNWQLKTVESPQSPRTSPLIEASRLSALVVIPNELL